MNRQNLLKTLAIIAIVILYSSCGCRDEMKYYIPQEFKTYNIFPVNSWWVYSINGENFDTVFVQSSTIEPPDDTFGNDCNSYENYYATYYTSSYGTFYINGVFDLFRDSIGSYMECYTTNQNNWYKNEALLLQMYEAKEYSPVINFGSGVYLPDSELQISIEEQIKIGSGYWLENEFDSVSEVRSIHLKIFRSFDFKDLDTDIQNNINILPPFRVYYARGIGLVRKEMYNGDVWELEDYFISN